MRTNGQENKRICPKVKPFILRTTPFVSLSRRPAHGTAYLTGKSYRSPTTRSLIVHCVHLFFCLIRHFFLTERDFSPAQSTPTHFRSLTCSFLVLSSKSFSSSFIRFAHSLQKKCLHSLRSLTPFARSLRARTRPRSLTH